MIKLTQLPFLLLFVLVVACSDESVIPESYLGAISSEAYHESEILPDDFQDLYGIWRHTKISGGFAGVEREAPYDYLELKPFGVYGIVRNDSLIEYGKVELFTFDQGDTGMLQVKFTAEFLTDEYSFMSPPEKFIRLTENRNLDIYSPCCDQFNSHYEKVK